MKLTEWLHVAVNKKEGASSHSVVLTTKAYSALKQLINRNVRSILLFVYTILELYSLLSQ